MSKQVHNSWIQTLMDMNHRSLPPEFESGHGHIWRVFHFWLRSITFRGHSAHLAYRCLVHKSGCKRPIITNNSWWTWKFLRQCYINYSISILCVITPGCSDSAQDRALYCKPLRFVVQMRLNCVFMWYVFLRYSPQPYFPGVSST